MNWKAAGVGIFILSLCVWAGLSASATTNPDQRSLRDSYRRPATPYPSDDPYSEAKALLGRMLFFDRNLSGARTLSCASCHNPSLSWADGRARAKGEKTLPLRTPTLLAIAWIPVLGWDGKFHDLETVAFGPITSPDNMNLPEDVLIRRLSATPAYKMAFSATFNDGAVTRHNIELALATFERSIVPQEAPFDRWVAGDETAIGAAAKRGFVLFNGKAHCAACHSGYAFSDGSFHDIGSARGHDLGRGRLFPTSIALQYAFKTPTLRDVARRAPYMHDGSVATLRDVIALYDRGGIVRPSRSPEIAPLGLSAGEKSDLVAFLNTLTSLPAPGTIGAAPRTARPAQAAR
jgi:cytochrome c peroxidase